MVPLFASYSGVFAIPTSRSAFSRTATSPSSSSISVADSESLQLAPMISASYHLPLPSLLTLPRISRAVDERICGISQSKEARGIGRGRAGAGNTKVQEAARVLAPLAQVVPQIGKYWAGGADAGGERAAAANDGDFKSGGEAARMKREREEGPMKSDTADIGGATGEGGKGTEGETGGGERRDGQGTAGDESGAKRRRRRQKIAPVRSIAESLND